MNAHKGLLALNALCSMITEIKIQIFSMSIFIPSFTKKRYSNRIYYIPSTIRYKNLYLRHICKIHMWKVLIHVNKNLHSKGQPSYFGFTLLGQTNKWTKKKKKAKQNQTTKLIWAVKLLIIPMQVQWICNKSKYNRFSPIQKVFHLSEP